MRTFQELYQHIVTLSNEEYVTWLSTPWVGKDKQESLFRLFMALGIVPELDGYTFCQGNFNLGQTEPNELRFFWKRSLKDKGDKADMVLENKDTIIAFTSKNRTSHNINNMDIDAIQNIHSTNYRDKKLRIGFCVPDKKEFLEATERGQKTSDRLKQAITNESTIILDWHTLKICFTTFKLHFTGELPVETKRQITPYFHQLLLTRLICMKLKANNTVLCSAISRSGKTYIMGLLAKQLKPDNILLTTLKPSENLEDYREFFNKFDFEEYTISFVDGKSKKPELGRKNIIVCSEQFLRGGNENKITAIKWLRDMAFDISIIDEPHDGGTTDLADYVYKTYAKKSKKVFFTSTYNKVMNRYNIPPDCIVGWDFEDIHSCKNLDKERLVRKYGDVTRDVLACYSDTVIKETYSRYPEMVFQQEVLKAEEKQKLLERLSMEPSPYGWSTQSLFMLNENGGFLRPDDVGKFMEHIFGKNDPVVPDEKCIISRIHRKCADGGSRKPFTILMFIDPINIVKTSENIKTFIPEQYETLIMNGYERGGQSVSSMIKKAELSAVNKGKIGTVIIAGAMCNSGITIKKCDVVLMLDNGKSYDAYYQKMFRCMTEDTGKKYGFVYDFNIQRSLNIVAEMAIATFPEEKDREKAILRALEQKLIHFNDGYFTETSQLASFIYKSWLTDISVTRDIIGYLKNISIPEKFRSICNKVFHVTKSRSESSIELEKEINEVIGGKDRDFPKGVEEITEETKEKKDLKNYFQEVFPYVTVYSILFTLSDREYDFAEMCKTIMCNEYYKKIALNQMRTCWGEKVPDNIFELFIEIYQESLKDDAVLMEEIRHIKERFMAIRGKPYDFYGLIEEYLTPRDIERKVNAEVSTPLEKANEMLDTVPISLWSKKVRVFEPCCGKGVFLLLLVDRFMKGLKEVIPDEEKRRRLILEKMLYFADINPLNIFICKLLLDPENKYKLNYYEGDTLELDVKQVFGVEKFSLIVSNPPYSTNPSLPNTKALYNLFIEKYIDMSSYFLFVTPSRWFSGGKGLDKFRVFMLGRKDIKVIRHYANGKDFFPTVSIAGGVSYFLKVPYTCHCLFNGTPVQLSKYDILVEPENIELIEKVMKYPSITEIYMNAGYYRVRTNDKRLRDEKNEGDVVCYVSSFKKKDRKRYVDRKFLKDSTWKVITAEASAEGFGFMAVAKPDEIYTDSYVGFRVQSEEEGKNLMSYLKCSLVTKLLTVRKMTQHINTSTVKWIPLVPLDREWTDEKVREYFKL